MRTILRKLDQKQDLNANEYRSLMEYADKLRSESPESYQLFYDKYALLLYQEYSIYLPRFVYEFDDLLNYVLSHPEVMNSLPGFDISAELFPRPMQPYLQYALANKIDFNLLRSIFNYLGKNRQVLGQLPAPRPKELICKYEDANPYKEIGLRAHFDRLGRYSFITRLQSYRYLRRNKASHDRIEFIANDRLGGIFTNKEKSIYYYIFLSEDNAAKARNACELLNTVLYGFGGEV